MRICLILIYEFVFYQLNLGYFRKIILKGGVRKILGVVLRAVIIFGPTLNESNSHATIHPIIKPLY